MTATEQSSQEQPPVTGPSTASTMDVDKPETDTGKDESQPLADGLNAKPNEVIELPPEDEFGDDVPVFDDNDVLDDCTNSILADIQKEMAKQGVDTATISGGDSKNIATTSQVPSDSGNGTSDEPSEQQEANGINEEDAEEQKPLLENFLSLQELISMVKEEATKKIDEPEEKLAKRFDQMTKIIDEIQALEKKGRESSSVKTHLAVKIEELQLAPSMDKAIRYWRQLIEDLDCDLKTRKSRARKRLADQEKIQELKRLKQPIPKELTKRGNARISEKIKQSQKEINKLRKKISRLESKPMSLDDLGREDSVYLKSDRLYKRINSLVKKVAELQGYSQNDRRPIYQPIKYNESNYEDINEAISKEVTKLVKEKRLDPKIKMRGMAPDLQDIDDIVKNTPSGKLMKEGDRHIESRAIFKSIINELRARREEEFVEYIDQLESDEELSKTDVHEVKDEELEKKLIPLDEARERMTNVVNDYVSRRDKMTAEELAADEAEALKDEEQDEKAAAEKDENEDLDDEDEDDDELDEDELGDDGELVTEGEPSQGCSNELDTVGNKEDSDDDEESDDEAVESGGENELVDLASDDEGSTSDAVPSVGLPTDDDTPFGTNDVGGGDMGSGFKNDGEEDEDSGPPMKKLKKTTDDVEEITLSSDDEN